MFHFLEKKAIEWVFFETDISKFSAMHTLPTGSFYFLIFILYLLDLEAYDSQCLKNMVFKSLIKFPL